MAMEKTTPTKNAESYTVELKMAEKTFKSTGKTIVEAFDNLKEPQLKGKCVLKVKKGKIEYTKLRSIAQMKRFYGNRVSRLTLAKYFETGYAE